MARSVTLGPFDVVVVPFPCGDVRAEKRRPAVVVSAPELESQTGLIWLAMVSSTGQALRFGDVQLTDLQTAGLSVKCRVRASKLATLDVGRVVRRAGALSSGDASAVFEALNACLGRV